MTRQKKRTAPALLLDDKGKIRDASPGCQGRNYPGWQLSLRAFDIKDRHLLTKLEYELYQRIVAKTATEEDKVEYELRRGGTPRGSLWKPPDSPDKGKDKHAKKKRKKEKDPATPKANKKTTPRKVPEAQTAGKDKGGADDDFEDAHADVAPSKKKAQVKAAPKGKQADKRLDATKSSMARVPLTFPMSPDRLFIPDEKHFTIKNISAAMKESLVKVPDSKNALEVGLIRDVTQVQTCTCTLFPYTLVRGALHNSINTLPCQCRLPWSLCSRASLPTTTSSTPRAPSRSAPTSRTTRT